MSRFLVSPTFVHSKVGSPGNAQASYNGHATLGILEIVQIFFSCARSNGLIVSQRGGKIRRSEPFVPSSCLGLSRVMYALLGPPPALRKLARTIKSLSALSQQAALFSYFPSSSTYRIVADLSAPFSLRKTPKYQGIQVTISTPSILPKKICCWQRSWNTIGN